MGRGFSETEKDNIRDKLLRECEKSWAAIGYKNTKIDDLCSRAGISKGAFYAFFDSKEHLFCKLHDISQERQIAIGEKLPDVPTKYDISRLMKQIYLDYDSTQVLRLRNSPDYISFLNRAPKEWIETSRKKSEDFIFNHIFNPHLTLKMSREKTIGVFNALLGILTMKELLGYDHYEIFCTLLDSVIEEIYE